MCSSARSRANERPDHTRRESSRFPRESERSECRVKLDRTRNGGRPCGKHDRPPNPHSRYERGASYPKLYGEPPPGRKGSRAETNQRRTEETLRPQAQDLERLRLRVVVRVSSQRPRIPILAHEA